MTALLPDWRTGSAADLRIDTGGATPGPATRGRRPPTWRHRYRVGLVLTDVSAIVAAVVAGYLLRFGTLRDDRMSMGYLGICVVLVGLWVATLAGVGAYEVKHMSTGLEEFRRVLLGTVLAAGGVAIVCYVGKIAIARGFIGGAVPIGLAVLVFGRMTARHVVRARRARGGWSYRILVAGTAASVADFVRMTRANPGAGMSVIGACVEDARIGTEIAPGVPVLGGVTTVALAAATVDADVVALTGQGLGASTIRELGWSLEGSGRDLMMVPGLTEVAGPRVHVAPVEGLPIMWVDQPVLRGYKRVLKRGVDVGVSGLLLLLLSPVLAAVAVAIKLDTPGGVFFRQERFGKNGRPFTIWKFRSMSQDAASQHRRVMTEAGSSEGVLFFKLVSDPRVTRVGRVLRKLSLDELPQLLNVLDGSMSLVGPRPQCDHEVARYDGATRRRLLVKPGMTGLWQVSGRSDLDPVDGVRLDLYYVENWSLALDVAVIARTVHAVLRSRGAY